MSLYDKAMEMVKEMVPDGTLLTCQFCGERYPFKAEILGTEHTMLECRNNLHRRASTPDGIQEVIALRTKARKLEVANNLLVEALWGYDENVNNGKPNRGYFCSGCDIGGPPGKTPMEWHDSECRKAQQALSLVLE